MREVDVAVLTETKSKRTDHFRIPGYNLIKCNEYGHGDGGAEGVAIFFRTEFAAEEIDKQGKEIEGIEWVGCRIKTKEEMINIIGVYRPPRVGR